MSNVNLYSAFSLKTSNALWLAQKCDNVIFSVIKVQSAINFTDTVSQTMQTFNLAN